MITTTIGPIYWVNGSFVPTFDWLQDVNRFNNQVTGNILVARHHTKEHFFLGADSCYARLACDAATCGFKLGMGLSDFLQTLRAFKDKFRNSDYYVTLVATSESMGIVAMPHTIDTKVKNINFALDVPPLFSESIEPIVITSGAFVEGKVSDLVVYYEGSVYFPEFPKHEVTNICKEICSAFGSDLAAHITPRTIADLAKAEAVVFLSDKSPISLSQFPAPELSRSGKPSKREAFVQGLENSLSEILRGRVPNYASFFR